MRFFQTILILLAAFGLLTFFPLSARCQNQEASEVNKRSQPKNIYAKQLAQNIPKADPKKYYPVGDSWKNPRVFVESGIYIIMENKPERQLTSIADLAKDLAALPSSDWPLGRVVLFSQSGRIPLWLKGQKEPDSNAFRNVRKAQDILRSLDVDYITTPIN